MFQDIILTLQKIGLKNKEARIYLICLHFQEGLYVHEIVKQSNINRSTIDIILDKLLEKRYISRVKVGVRYKYFAQSPESILLKKEQLLEDFRTLVPVLSNLKTQNGETEIRFFEGTKGLREIHDDILIQLKFAKRNKKQIVSFVSGIDAKNIFPDMQSRFVEKRVSMGVWFRGIAPKSSEGIFEYSKSQDYLREMKHVDDKKFPFQATFETYADSVMIYSPTKPYGGIVIRNPKIADSMRSLFNLIWDLLPS